jgi:hypothetical protein
MRGKPICAIVALVSTIFFVAGCNHTIPKEALQLAPEALATRQLQTRKFPTGNERQLLSASAQVLQDLGFALDESETKLGVIVASKDRDATESGQVALAVFVALFGGGAMPIDEKQKIRASLVTRPIPGSDKSISVRITFQRIVWNTHNQISKLETLEEPKMYEEFFSKLSKAVFLGANQI